MVKQRFKLAAAAGITRTSLNQIENGVFPDLGVRKLQALLHHLGLRLALHPAPRSDGPDYIRMACTTANVSFKRELTEDELIHTLLTGKIPPGKQPHLRVLLDEATPSLLKGLVMETSRWTKPGRIEKNLMKIARDIGATRRITEWLKTA